VLRKLGIPTKDAGLHVFRHGLATELADKNAPIPVLQKQMRHADVRTTLALYAHVIPQSLTRWKLFQLEQFQLWNKNKQQVRQTK
jgi:integrase